MRTQINNKTIIQEQASDGVGHLLARSAEIFSRLIFCQLYSPIFGILHPVKLHITHNGKDRQFQDPDEAMAYVKANNL